MSIRVAAVIIDQDKILLMYRYKNGEEYYTLVGGSIEDGETEELALIREVKEETNLDINGIEKLWQIENRGRQENYFLVKSFVGEMKLGEPEFSRQTPNDVYKLEWVALKNLANLTLLPLIIKKQIIDRFVK